MCGIIGAVSPRDISKLLLEGLRRLEYRGYDSAGVALLEPDGELKRFRVQGKVQVLADVLEKVHCSATLGIAHTRWATHGKPSEQNAHPHVSHGELALVHNGIIENHDELRAYLLERGYEFYSETDTEVAVHLIHYCYQEYRALLPAVQSAVLLMKGSFSFGVIHSAHPFGLIAVRKGSPLIIGIGLSEQFIASDVLALRSFVQSVIFLEDGDSARLTFEKIEIFNANQQEVVRPIQPVLIDDPKIPAKGTFKHFMIKEIFDQTNAMVDSLEGRATNLHTLRSIFTHENAELFDQIEAIHIVACGTSYHAGLVAKYWLESLSRIPTQVDVASEYRYRDIVVRGKTLFIAVSQSGETADTLAALHKAKDEGYVATFAICNVTTSALVRESDGFILTRAGSEISVASTKAFTTQLSVFLMLAAALCRDKRAEEVLVQLQKLPLRCEQALKINHEIEKLAGFFVKKHHALFLGRGVQYPVALEGALKLKELSYIHAEAYPAGELKHGPLALIDKNMPVVVVAPNDELLDKLKTNLQEVSARGGQLIVFVDDSLDWQAQGVHLIRVPACEPWIAPIIYTIPLQLLAYHVAVAKGTDVDQPRNLAKSVTVE